MTLVTKVVSDSNVKNTNVTFTTPSQRAVNGSQANSTSSVANKVTSQAASQTANSQIKNTSSQATSYASTSSNSSKIANSASTQSTVAQSASANNAKSVATSQTVKASQEVATTKANTNNQNTAKQQVTSQVTSQSANASYASQASSQVTGKTSSENTPAASTRSENTTVDTKNTDNNSVPDKIASKAVNNTDKTSVTTNNATTLNNSASSTTKVTNNVANDEANTKESFVAINKNINTNSQNISKKTTVNNVAVQAVRNDEEKNSDNEVATSEANSTSTSEAAPVKVPNKELDNAINSAKQAGVTVNTTNGKVYQSEADIQKDYEAQIANVQNAVKQQEQYNQEYQQAEKQYEEDKANYEKEEENFQKQLASSGMSNYDKVANNNFNPNGLNPAQVKNYLTLGAEPDAQVSYKVLNNDVTVSNQPIDTSASSSNHGNWEGLDSKYEVKVSANNRNVPMNTPLVTVTYTNLHNSFYNNQGISKIVRTFSFAGGCNGTGNPGIDIYDDPSEGINFGSVNGVDVTTTFYDANGNVININADHPAYMAVTSLNDWWGTKTDNDNGGNAIENSQGDHAKHVEYAEALNGCSAEALQGSPVSVHNGNTLYSDITNGNTLPDGTVWDKSHSPLQFYGSGIIKITSSTSTIRYGVYLGKQEAASGSGEWATSTTNLPATPPVMPQDVANPPKLQHATVTVHEDSIQPETITVHYVDQHGNEIPNVPTEKITSVPGTSYNTSSKNIPGYTYNDETGLPSDGKMPDKGGDIYYHYDQPASIKIHYIDDDNGQEMPNMPVKTVNGNVGDKYDETQPTVKGFNENPETGLPTSGTMTAKGGDIYFHYKTEKGTVHTTYVDSNGKPIASPTDETGKTGTPYTTEPKNIPGYHLEKETGAPANGVYNNGEQDVVYHYVKDTPVATKTTPTTPSQAPAVVSAAPVVTPKAAPVVTPVASQQSQPVTIVASQAAPVVKPAATPVASSQAPAVSAAPAALPETGEKAGNSYEGIAAALIGMGLTSAMLKRKKETK